MAKLVAALEKNTAATTAGQGAGGGPSDPNAGPRNSPMGNRGGSNPDGGLSAPRSPCGCSGRRNLLLQRGDLFADVGLKVAMHARMALQFALDCIEAGAGLSTVGLDLRVDTRHLIPKRGHLARKGGNSREHVLERRVSHRAQSYRSSG